jgi:UDP-N-acetylglucosamine 1-carboxyvinyltransferase
MPQDVKEQFVVSGLQGEKTLEGAIVVGGAKNAVLPASAASLLSEGPLVLTNVPHIEDVLRMSELLAGLGVKISHEASSLTLHAGSIASSHIERESAKRMRSSVFLTGPLLARYGEARFPHPGGCVIGERPIDQFLKGFAKMGATIAHEDEWYVVRAKGDLMGATIFFDLVSVSATETFMMAATLARGTTVLENCATEPEVVFLAELLRRGGAQIYGDGTSTIHIEGGELLTFTEPIAVIPDRIETSSFLLLAALAGKNIAIEKCNPQHVRIVTQYLESTGVPLDIGGDHIRIHNNTHPNASFVSTRDIRTHEYPGFPTDIQAPLTVFLTQVTGENTVFETIFENRLGYSDDLIKMGADITVWNPQKMMVRGPKKLKGRELMSPDLRAGLAFIIAAIVADGNSIVGNAYYIDRGYQHIEQRLKAIGVAIERQRG